MSKNKKRTLDKRFSLKQFKKICRMEETELLYYLESRMCEFYNANDIIFTLDYLYCKGDIPVMLVAHLDTVHFNTPVQIFYDKKYQVVFSPQGIGADDRAGVYAILEILKSGYRPFVLFTTYEEYGGIGASRAADKIIPTVDFLIQLDRKGKGEAVFYETVNKKFKNYINNFGFIEQYGIFSDISILTPEWKINSVNLSVGYQHAHCKHEYLDIKHLYYTIDKVKEILCNLPENEEIIKYIEPPKKYKLKDKNNKNKNNKDKKQDKVGVSNSTEDNDNGKYEFDDFNYYNDLFADVYGYCDNCNNKFHIDDLMHYNQYYICKYCYGSYGLEVAKKFEA